MLPVFIFMRLRIFIDFWNFTLNWNARSGGAKPDWTALPRLVSRESATLLTAAGLPAPQLEETRVYASYEPVKDNSLRNWLNTFLDRQPGVRVFQTERHWKKHPSHCRACHSQIVQCPQCGADLGRAAEKAIDSLIVTDLMSLAWENAYDVALLVSSDRDFIPAIERLQSKNLKFINAGWRGQGFELARKCWASFQFDGLIPQLVRP